MRDKMRWQYVPALPESPHGEIRFCLGHPGYAVDVSGRVWSCRNSREGWRQLRATVCKNGYPYVTLQSPRRDCTHAVHRLVLEAFCGLCPAGHECRHLDGCRDNPALSNLCWGTRKQNTNDKKRHGTFHEGEKHGNAKLRARDVRRIRAFIVQGVKQQIIAARFGIDQATVSRIATGQAWTCVY